MTIEQLYEFTAALSSHNSSYASPKESKTGKPVSTFINGTSFFSLYDPLRDAQNFANQFSLQEPCFIIIGGLGNAYHIIDLYLRYTESFFLIIEDSYTSYKTLLHQNNFDFFRDKEAIHFCTIQDFESNLLNLYKPSLHGTLIFKSMRSWAEYHKKHTQLLQTIINSSLSKISADYSVQTHFGKVWMRNIIRNMNTFQNNPHLFTTMRSITSSVHNSLSNSNPAECRKTAAVVAAGPSLDDSIQELKKNQDNYYIIAADTALEILLKYEIKPDAFVTIDGQNVSSRLFTASNSKILSPSLAVIDCSAHPNAVQYAAHKDIPVILCSTGHPLIQWFQKTNPEIVSLTSGRGTVTITAADFAVQCGFKAVVFFGADFSCPKYKPYAKGTYLEPFFSADLKRNKTIDSLYSSLLFRTEVTRVINSADSGDFFYCTPLLSQYKDSLLSYIKSSNTSITFYSAIKGYLELPQYSANRASKVLPLEPQRLTKNKKILESFFYSAALDDTEVIETLLPYYAWYLHHNDLKPSKSAFFSFKTLVKKQFANYTCIHHES